MSPDSIRMYNLNENNENPASAVTLLTTAAAAVGTELTPGTPEIVSTVIAMTHPLEGYTPNNSSAFSNVANRIRVRNDSTSSSETSPPTVQLMTSRLIKEGIKKKFLKR